MRKAVAGVALLLLATVVASCGNGPDHTITGTVDLIECASSAGCPATSTTQPGSAGSSEMTPCRGGAHGYSDVVAGATITVRTNNGALIATGHLGVGTSRPTGCQLPFTISHVRNAHTYLIEVAHEGAQTFTNADLAASHYRLQLPLEPAPR